MQYSENSTYMCLQLGDSEDVIEDNVILNLISILKILLLEVYIRVTGMQTVEAEVLVEAFVEVLQSSLDHSQKTVVTKAQHVRTRLSQIQHHLYTYCCTCYIHRESVY